MTATLTRTGAYTNQAATVATLQHISAGPMLEPFTLSERVALLVLDVSAENGETDGIRMSELARRLGMSRAAITALVDRFETAGLVKRQADFADRRATKVTITDHGRATIDGAIEFDGEADQE